MPKTTKPQRLERLLRFLVALRDPELLLPLVEAGFTNEDLAEGWSLLRGTSIDVLPKGRPRVVNAVRAAEAELVEWARRHIRLVEPAIARRHEAVHAFLYGGLPELKAPKVILAVGVFLDRVQALSKKKGGPEARALLEERGLTAAAIDAVAPVLLRAKAIGVTPTGKPRDWAAAEQAAWRWYLEWSRVARESILDGRLRHRLSLTGREPAGA